MKTEKERKMIIEERMALLEEMMLVDDVDDNKFNSKSKTPISKRKVRILWPKRFFWFGSSYDD